MLFSSSLYGLGELTMRGLDWKYVVLSPNLQHVFHQAYASQGPTAHDWTRESEGEVYTPFLKLPCGGKGLRNPVFQSFGHMYKFFVFCVRATSVRTPVTCSG